MSLFKCSGQKGTPNPRQFDDKSIGIKVVGGGYYSYTLNNKSIAFSFSLDGYQGTNGILFLWTFVDGVSHNRIVASSETKKELRPKIVDGIILTESIIENLKISLAEMDKLIKKAKLKESQLIIYDDDIF